MQGYQGMVDGGDNIKELERKDIANIMHVVGHLTIKIIYDKATCLTAILVMACHLISWP